MKKNNWTKIMAIFALFWIIIWVIWTGILIIFDDQSTQPEITKEQYEQIMKQINSNSWTINTQSWITTTSTWINIWTWKVSE